MLGIVTTHAGTRELRGKHEVQSVTTESTMLNASAGATFLAMAALFAWRLVIEFEREWMRMLAAPPASFEADLGRRTPGSVAERREEATRATVEMTREPALI